MEVQRRLRGGGKHRVASRHIIDWLVRKPGAFENYRYRDELFPTSRFRMAWDALRELSPARANKTYLEILQLAAQEGEARVDDALRTLPEQGEVSVGRLSKAAVQALLAMDATMPAVTEVAVAEVSLASFDDLLSPPSSNGVVQ